INLYLEDALASELKHSTERTGKPRNAIIREAIKEWIANHQTKFWPKSVLNFKGCPEMPAFESYRKELIFTDEDPLKLNIYWIIED
ncbi:ribbon-helix-helix domain-containing protein, partial [Acinetobacter baumannii]